MFFYIDQLMLSPSGTFKYRIIIPDAGSSVNAKNPGFCLKTGSYKYGMAAAANISERIPQRLLIF